MRFHAKHAARGLLTTASWLLLASTAAAQNLVVVTCSGPGHCAYQRVYAVTLQGKDSVRTVVPSAADDPQAIRKAATIKLGSLAGLYQEPKSLVLRVLNPDGTLGDVVLPAKLPPSAATAAAALASSTFECQVQAKVQTRTIVPASQFVALLSGPRPAGSVVDFLRREVMAYSPHPFRSELVAAALAFAADSDELRAWRDQLVATMRISLAQFTNGGVDPTQLEAVLGEGLAAGQAYRTIFGDAQNGRAPLQELAETRRLFLERVTVASVFRQANMYDAFLEELDQLDLARWSRPELMAGVQDALQASAQLHARLASDFLNTKQYARAFDEASLASRRSPCDQRLDSLYNRARLQFVNATAVQSLPDYDNANRSELEQIVRALQGMRPDDLATPEGREDAKRRIGDGEAMDAHYLPLQLEKAQFLYNIKEYSAARDVVTDVERNVRLGWADVDKWLKLDAAIDHGLSTLRQRNEKLASEQMANGYFDAAFKSVTQGLAADPDNPRLLYAAAVSAAVQRDVASARHYAELYLRRPVLGCGESPEVTRSLLDLYHVKASAESPAIGDGRVPNWMSGEPYMPGEVYYDPLSGSFQAHISQVSVSEKSRSVSTAFQWNGFMAVSISTIEGAGRDEPAHRMPAVTTIEPVYDQKRVYMKEVTTESGAAGTTKRFALTYLNAPDFDPILASKLTGKVTTRGWAGNPFFHPFLWDGIYVFALQYDELGRLRKATPVSEGVSRPSLPFAETLTFTWEGNTKRLKSVSGEKYRREMSYDQFGRLVSETITHPLGKGSIEYHYDGMARLPSQAFCIDNFYDNARRIVTLAPPQR